MQLHVYRFLERGRAFLPFETTKMWSSNLARARQRAISGLLARSKCSKAFVHRFGFSSFVFSEFKSDRAHVEICEKKVLQLIAI